MIKTFEQFVNEMYSPINEAFQSSKLREIIKTHGMPKLNLDKKMLYDIKDNEIVDVLDNIKEYYDKKYDKNGYNGQSAFMIELKDGAVIVISNLGILKGFLNRYSKKEFDELFKKRHTERHKGNLGKHGGDDISKKHFKNVDKIYTRRFAERLQPIIPELVEKIKYEIESISDEELIESNSGKKYTTDFEIEIGENKYQIYADYVVNISDEYKRYGKYLCDIKYYLVSFEIIEEDGYGAKNEDLDITDKTYPDLFKDIVRKEVECGIYDYHEVYGVKPSDFI